jgi:hypothetical protein
MKDSKDNCLKYRHEFKKCQIFDALVAKSGGTLQRCHAFWKQTGDNTIMCISIEMLGNHHGLAQYPGEILLKIHVNDDSRMFRVA